MSDRNLLFQYNIYFNDMGNDISIKEYNYVIYCKIPIQIKYSGYCV